MLVETAAMLAQTDVTGGIATLTMNRPEQRNAISLELVILSLSSRLARAKSDETYSSTSSPPELSYSSRYWATSSRLSGSVCCPGSPSWKAWLRSFSTSPSE